MRWVVVTHSRLQSMLAVVVGVVVVLLGILAKYSTSVVTLGSKLIVPDSEAIDRNSWRLVAFRLGSELTQRVGSYSRDELFSFKTVKGADEVLQDEENWVSLHVFYPEEGFAREGASTLLHWHGGGFVIGAPETNGPVLRQIANRAGAPVITLSYRLAPEYPYPSFMEDAELGVRAVLRASKQLGLTRRELGGGKVAVPMSFTGDSAGGLLSVVTGLKVCGYAHGLEGKWDGESAYWVEENGVVADLIGVIPVYPGMDFSAHRRAAERKGHASYPSASIHAKNPPLLDFILNSFTLTATRSQEEADQWQLSPIRAAIPPPNSPLDTRAAAASARATQIRLKHDPPTLPPMLFIIAENDMLRDEGIQSAAAYREVGFPVSILEVKEAPHAFWAKRLQHPEFAEQGIEAIVQFLNMVDGVKE